MLTGFVVVSCYFSLLEIDVSAYFTFGGNERNSLFFVMGNCCKCLFYVVGIDVSPYFWRRKRNDCND